MNEIKFWLDSWRKILILLHIESNQTKKIRKSKEIEQFIHTYQVSLADLKGVQEGQDLLGYFKK